MGSKTQSTVASAQPAPAVSQPATESVAPAVETPAPAPAATPVAEPVAETPAPASEDVGKKSADDILNMIRNRQSS